MKTFAKSTICALYKYSGVMHAQEAVARWSGRAILPILLFHRVTDAIPPDGLTIDPRWFESLCRMLRQRFRVAPLAEVQRLLRTGVPVPPRTVALTFDDCYRDNLAAARVLANHGLPATFFVPTAYVGTDHVFEWDKNLPRMPNLSWDDVAEMTRLGHEIGSHTVHHADMGRVPPEQARHELTESKRTLEDRLQRPARWFAYPFGARQNFRPEYYSLVKEVGYEACFSAFGGFATPSMKDEVLPREPAPAFRSLLNFEMHLTGSLNWWYNLKRRAGLIV